jgi:pyridoxamine 5'-phosphate oxidase
MTGHEELLPDPLPDDPLPMAAAWYRRAVADRVQPNPDAMVLATSDKAGRPSARVVLCKAFVANPGYLVFYTNYRSRKASDLDDRDRAAAVFHWDTLHRQLRIEGVTRRSPPAESDDYFSSRPWRSRIGAWASRQSRPLPYRSSLVERVARTAAEFGASCTTGADSEPEIPRPGHWGGYRLWIDRIELWVEGADRIHDRACWTRSLTAGAGHGHETGAWCGTRLEP